MIEPERVLYYFEHVALLLDESCMRDEPKTEGHREWLEFHRKNLDKFLETFYMFCHIGTAAMHNCQHPDWEEAFLKIEQEMIDSRHMTPYHVVKERGPMTENIPMLAKTSIMQREKKEADGGVAE